MKILIDCFEINALLSFISSKIPFPQTIEESLQFISKSYCEFFKKQFVQSLSLIIQHFNSLTFKDFDKLTNSQLLKIFSSESLQIENEDYLLDLIMNMINKDKNRMILLQTIRFEFVSSHLLKSLFNYIFNDEIDFELFESLKKRLFTDYSDQEMLSTR
jgi:hypothetical protein